MPTVVELLVILLSLCLPTSRAEFTVIMSDSSTLVDAPQTGFSDRARTDPAEQKAVYEIMVATGNGWAMSIPDVCRGRWHGIECMPDKDEVYHVISLSFGALSDDTAFPICHQRSSFLSPAIANLPHIRTLFFYRCFTGNPQPIPPILGHLGTTLRTLVLRDNGHVGPIPAELGNLTSLKVLDLHGNALSSSIPASLSSLTRLQLLDLSGNRLTGTIAHLAFPDLNILDLSSNRLQGRISPALGTSCAALVKMDLSKNRLTGPIPDTMGNLKTLILVDLSENHLSGPIPEALNGLTSLRALILGWNSMSPATIPETGFAGLTHLETLVLSSMGLQGPIPEALGRLPALRVLHLDGNRLSGAVPATFRDMGRLSELRINDNRLTGPIPFDWKMIWRIRRKLRVGGNPGLCYHGSDPRGVTADASVLEGISSCEAIRAALTGAPTFSSSTVASSSGHKPGGK